MAEAEFVKHYCSTCKGPTNSKILYSHTHTGVEHDVFHWESIYRVVECAGCNQPSFRLEQTDDSMVNEDQQGEYHQYYDIQGYPLNIGNGYSPLMQTYTLPTRIRTVYLETIQALKINSYLLAAVGFRTIIEAICIENEIKGGSLEAKIKNCKK